MTKFTKIKLDPKEGQNIEICACDRADKFVEVYLTEDNTSIYFSSMEEVSIFCETLLEVARSNFKIKRTFDA
jgi:hypothetical protein